MCVVSVSFCVSFCLLEYVSVAPVLSLSVLLCGCVGLCLVVHVRVRADVVTACVHICVCVVSVHVCVCVCSRLLGFVHDCLWYI